MIRSQADGGSVEAAFGGRDELLASITISCLTETAGAAARVYRLGAETMHGHAGGPRPGAKSAVHAGIALLPRVIQAPAGVGGAHDHRATRREGAARWSLRGA